MNKQKNNNKKEVLLKLLMDSPVSKLIVAVIVPLVAGVILWQVYLFLRDVQAPKIIMTFVAIVWGVGGVLSLYFISNWLLQMLPVRYRVKLTPFLFVGPALVILSWYLLFPTIRSLFYSFYDDSQKVYHFTNDKRIKNRQGGFDKEKLTEEDKATIISALEEIDFYKEFEKWLIENGQIKASNFEVKPGKIPLKIPESYFIKKIIPKLPGGWTQQKLFRSVYTSKDRFIFIGNYIKAFKSSNFLVALRNNVIWIILGPGLAVFFGLLIAFLAERSSFEVVAKTLIFMPMAISFIGAGVIWKFIYAYQPPGESQIGLLNAIVTLFGGEPQNWLTISPLNSVLLVFILVWMQTGYAMVLLSSAIKGVSEDILEAARIDGASEFKIIVSVIIPCIKDTVITVWTTITILSLKVFDIVYSMTGGNFNTDVLATLQYKEMFVYKNYNMGSAYAIILLIAVIPAVVYNLKQFQSKEAF